MVPPGGFTASVETSYSHTTRPSTIPAKKPVQEAMPLDKYELLTETAKRRGFFWPSFEIYGGTSGFLDLGPLGVALRRRIEEKWRDLFIRRQQLIEISTPIITPGRILEASGHVQNFKDPMVECQKCHRRFRADHTLKEQTNINVEGLTLQQLAELLKKHDVHCSECGGLLGEPQYFLTMFQTNIGPYTEAQAYGRPEAAQGIFTNFRRLTEIARERLPLGIAQIGTVLRNEISPRQGPIRLREFTIMEFEYFFDPENPQCPHLHQVQNEHLNLVTAQQRQLGNEDPVAVTVHDALRKKLILSEWHAYFMALSKQFVTQLGIPPAKQRFHEKLPNERSHYSRQTFDHEAQLDRWGWVELAGHAYRGDYDLNVHAKGSGVDLRIFQAYEKPVEQTKKVLVPVQSKLGTDFKEEASNIKTLIADLDPEMAEKQLKETGYIEVDGHKLIKDHIKFETRIVKETGRRFLPHVVEPSYGAERLVYATLEYALEQKEDRAILKLPRGLAPVQAAVYPLVSKDGLPELAQKLYQELLEDGFDLEYDDSGSIGRRYARADEAGIPIAITIDYQTLKDNTVTIRDRDTWKQKRATEHSLPEILTQFLNGKAEFDQLPGQEVAQRTC